MHPRSIGRFHLPGPGHRMDLVDNGERFFILLFPLAQIFACHSESAGSAQVQAARAIGTKIAEARCACTELQQGTASRETCIDGQERVWERDVISPLRSGRLVLQDAQLDRCLSLLRGCAVQSHLEPPCFGLYQGQVPLGELCLQGQECRSGVCDRTSVELCSDRSVGRCAPRLNGDGFCADNSFCVDAFTCQGGGCKPALQAGDPCADTAPFTRGCAPGLVCVPVNGQYVCGAQRAAGEPCGIEEASGWTTGFAACREGLLCSTTSFRCDKPGPPNPERRALMESCLVSGPTAMTCGVELQCIDGHCALARLVGEACEQDRDCATYFCREGTCRDQSEKFACVATGS